MTRAFTSCSHTENGKMMPSPCKSSYSTKQRAPGDPPSSARTVRSFWLMGGNQSGFCTCYLCTLQMTTRQSATQGARRCCCVSPPALQLPCSHGLIMVHVQEARGGSKGGLFNFFSLVLPSVRLGVPLPKSQGKLKGEAVIEVLESGGLRPLSHATSSFPSVPI